ncbi:MAG: FAD binding domain-containing protein [Vulcanimicrobiaceae bacterium]
MMPAAFEYTRPASLQEAVAILAGNADAKLLAGGHSLIPMMKMRLAAPSLLVDIQAIPELSGVHYVNGHFTLGALTTHASLAASEVLHRHARVLWDAANALGDPQVRNRGTIGGALAHGDPACDFSAAAHALDATLTLFGKNGTRSVPIANFLHGMFDTALARDEVLTEIAFEGTAHSAYTKFAHPASHYPLVGVAVKLDVHDRRVKSARVAVTGVADTAFRADAVEKALEGVDPGDEAAVKAACAGVTAGVDVRSDIQASAAYRAAMADVYAARAVKAAAHSR